MFKFILGLFLSSAVALAAGRLQNSDFATLAQITGAGGTSAQLLNTSKIYDSTNAQLLDTTIAAKLNSSAFTDTAVTSKLLTGYVSGAGTVAATDTILQAIQKLNGNIGAITDTGITQLTGDVTAGPGSGSQAATIANNAVSDAKFRQSAALSVVGRSANSTGNVADIISSANHQVLRRHNTTVDFGSIDLSQSNTVGTSILGVANGGTGQSSYTDGQILIGNTTGNTLAKSTITAGTGISITNGPGSITIAATGGGGAGDIAGEAYIAGTSGCEPLRSSTTYGQFTDDTDCPGPTIVEENLGDWQTTDSDNIEFAINSLPAGRYIAYMNVFLGNGTAGAYCYTYFSDGTFNSSEGAIRVDSSGSAYSSVTMVAFLDYATSGNRTFTLFGKASGGTCYAFNWDGVSAYFQSRLQIVKISD